MNTNTATAKNTAKAHNFAGILPEGFPMPEEMEGLRVALPGLAALADKILGCGPAGLETRTRAQLWENKEEEVFRAYGMTWREYVAQVPGTEATTETKQEATTPDIYTLQGEELARFRYMENRRQAKDGNVYTVNRGTYNGAMSGACASRRAGIRPDVWAKRFKFSKEEHDKYSWIIAQIARIVWTMPVEELFAGKPAF